MSTRTTRLIGIAGLTSIALGVAGAIVDQMWTFPETGATAGEIAGYVDAQVFRDGRLPGWTAVVAVAAALAHLALLASLTITSGFFSLEGGVTIAIPATLFAWILGTSIALLRTRFKADRRGTITFR
jgi:hypothetical protein